jgi:hypothetical protein
MKLKNIWIIALCILSFYYTEQIALYVKSKNPIMQEIESNKQDLYVDSTNSILIDELYIIPGINGKEVNVNSSFNTMKKLNVYNESQIVYDQIEPRISLKDNKERIIIRGNSKKRKVSLIFEKESKLTEYLITKEYKINILINKEQYSTKYEMINYSTNKTTYNNIDLYLTKNSLNKNLCYITNKSLCKDKYIFQESLIINHSNISTNINKITSGEIILVKDTLTLNELDLLINKIKSQDLSIVPLSELISEIN